MFEARLMIEPALAACVAECASGYRVSSGDIECLRYRMFEAIQQAFRQGMAVTSGLAPSKALEFHKEIYAAIHLRDGEGARRKMTEHLKNVTTILKQACLGGQLSERAK